MLHGGYFRYYRLYSVAGNVALQILNVPKLVPDTDIRTNKAEPHSSKSFLLIHTG